MLLQTNSYIVPKEKRAEHSRLIRRFRQTLLRLGCDHFEVYEQVGSNWSNSESAGRYVQILRFLDRKHQLAVQSAERSDPTAQAVIADFCDLINFPYQQQQGLFAVGFYTSVLPVAPKRGTRGELVSTVEHEVIDDPEAEKPYPGASDGPPLQEAIPEEHSEPIVGESQAGHASEHAAGHADPFDSPLEETGEEPLTGESEPQGKGDTATEDAVFIAAETGEGHGSAEASRPEESKNSEESDHSSDHSDESDHEFMKLVDGDLEPEPATATPLDFEALDSTAIDLNEESSSGFIEAEPAEHKSKERPAGW